MFDFLSAWRGIRQFRRIPPGELDVVFYSDGASDWPHLSPIARALAEKGQCQIAYVCSKVDDPALESDIDPSKVFYIGSGGLRTAWFRTTRIPLMVMTLPDLDRLFLKRSAYGGRYIYVHHSLISLQMAYPAGAFAAFDSMFCAGAHHVHEARYLEKMEGSPHKDLREIGYPRLDSIRKTALEASAGTPQETQKSVLLAPSWGKTSILHQCGEQLLKCLDDTGIETIVRPHPMTLRDEPELIKDLQSKFEKSRVIRWDSDVSSHATYEQSDIMISDWSGAAIEFAFAYERPVLFLDVPRKVRNEDFGPTSPEPIEVSIRSKLGALVNLSDIEKLPEEISALRSDVDRHVKQIQKVRDETTFHLDHSADIAAEALLDMLAEAKDSVKWDA